MTIDTTGRLGRLPTKGRRSTKLALSWLLACSLAASLAVGVAWAQDIYSGLQSTIAANSAPNSRVAVLKESQGLPLWGLVGNESAKYDLTVFYDRCIVASWITTFKDCFVSQIYRELPGATEWGRREFSNEEKADYERFMDLLFARQLQPDGAYVRTPGYSRYLELLAEYNVLKKQFDATPPNERTAAAAAKLAEARQKLSTEGQQSLFREAESRLKQLISADYSKSSLSRLRQSASSVVDANGKVRIALTPSLSPRMKLADWRQIGFVVSSTTLASAPFGKTPAGVRAMAYARSSDGAVTEIPLPSSLRVSAQLARIKISRPWLDIEGLRQSSGQWRWKDQVRGKLSESDLAAQSATDAAFSLLPLEVHLLREIVLEGEWSDDAETKIALAIQSGAEIRLGPLLLNSIDGDKAPSVQPYFRTARTLVVDAPQLVGVTAASLPTLPASAPGVVFGRPLPNLPFP